MGDGRVDRRECCRGVRRVWILLENHHWPGRKGGGGGAGWKRGSSICGCSGGVSGPTVSGLWSGYFATSIFLPSMLADGE